MSKPNDKMADTIGKRVRSLILENSLVGSIRFSKNCKMMGLEPNIVLCIVAYNPRSPVVGFKARLVCPHFYTEVNGKRYEVSDKPDNPESRRPKILAILARF